MISSCKKFETITPDATPKMTELKVSNTFDWKTQKDITFNVIGLQGVDSKIANTMYIKSSNGEIIYFKDYLIMNQNYTLRFAVPSYEKTLIIVYGSKNSNVDITSNELTYDYTK